MSKELKSYGDFMSKLHEACDKSAVISPSDKAFIGLHTVDKTADRNGNGDDVFKGTTKKDHSKLTSKAEVTVDALAAAALKKASGGASENV